MRGHWGREVYVVAAPHGANLPRLQLVPRNFHPNCTCPFPAHAVPKATQMLWTWEEMRVQSRCLRMEVAMVDKLSPRESKSETYALPLIRF